MEGSLQKQTRLVSNGSLDHFCLEDYVINLFDNANTETTTTTTETNTTITTIATTAE